MKTIWYRLFYPYNISLCMFLLWVIIFGMSYLDLGIFSIILHIFSYWFLALWLLGVYLFQTEAKEKLLSVTKEQENTKKKQTKEMKKKLLVGKILMKSDMFTIKELNEMELNSLKRISSSLK